MQIIGHRGARGLFAENTLEGFERTLALDVDGIELDVAVTRDRVPVVVHDPALNPDIARRDGVWLEGPGPLIRDLSLAAIAAYDVGQLRPGSTYSDRYPTQQPIDGARIPTLAAALALPARITVEVKFLPTQPAWTLPAEAMAEAVIAAIDAAGAGGRVVVQSFGWRVTRLMRAARPDLAFAWLTAPETEADATLWWDGPCPADFSGSVPRAVAAEGGSVWSPEQDSFLRENVAEAQALGLRVVPWTVNDPQKIDRLIGWGVDGLITDYPDIVRHRLDRAAAGQ